MSKKSPKSVRVPLPDELQELISRYHAADIEGKKPISELARAGIADGIAKSLGIKVSKDIAVMGKANNPHGLGGRSGKTIEDVKTK